ncbi:MAG: glucose-1-phosphate thymidylyltransferase [Alphaproteobacteria bacterium]|jgi:glucose-1-phosphate thymidylyltransferase
MKGIILAGGSGTRMRPMTKATNKHFLPVYDKPMIYYPLTTLMLAGIKDILIICNPGDLFDFKEMFADGSQWGIKISYKTQEKANGIAEAFIIGEEFIDGHKVALILGDNIFFGHGFGEHLKKASQNDGATVFGFYVKDPSAFGVAKLDSTNSYIVDLVEKPTEYISNYAIPGLYFYGPEVIDIAKKLKPSERGEIEITDINRIYLNDKKLNFIELRRGFAWFDGGSADSMLDASNYIAMVDRRQGLRIGCPEEVAYRYGWISEDTFLTLAEELSTSDYGKYLKSIAHILKVQHAG